MKAAVLNLSDGIEAARYYLKQGFKVHPVVRQGNHKSPIHKNWPTRDAKLQDFEADHNIGLRLGEEFAKGQFLVDVDLDMKCDDNVTPFPGAADVVDELLPTSTIVFGRTSSPRAHRLYLASAPIELLQFASPKGGMLIELRGLSKKGKKPIQTVIPPGIHETGEPIRYVSFGPPTAHDADFLRDAVRYAAVALAILRIWPAKGQRHWARLAFSKVLNEAGLPDPLGCAILKAITRATGGNPDDAVACYFDTATKDTKDTVGASWVREELPEGRDTLTLIDKILGREHALPTDTFDVTEMDLKRLTPQVWQRVADTNVPALKLLQGGVPVRVTHLPENRADKRPTWVFQPLEVDRLRHEVTQVATFHRKTAKAYRQVVSPLDLLKDMLATPPARVPLPVVTRIVYVPTMAADGTIQLAPGYQAATGTFYVEGGLSIRPVSDQPTPDEVARAVSLIREPLQDFAFVAAADRAAAVAFYLLPFVRNLIDGPTPLHLFKKPVAGAGATLLTDTLLYPSVGNDIARMSTVSDDDEWRKQITSTLLDGPSVVLIDNARELLSPQLAKVLTDDVWQARILGVSRNAVLRVECVWGATGINPDLHQEITRRIVPCRIDPQVEQPWLRDTFTIPNLRLWSREHRGEMIWAALTLARAWHVAGRPEGERSLGMFESWAHVIGGILKNAGFADFLGNLREVYEEADVEGDAIHWFLSEWQRLHQSQPKTISEVAMWALGQGSPMLDLMTSENGRNEKFSKWVRRLRGRVVELNGQPVRIEPVSTNGKSRTHTWRLVSLSGAPLPSVGTAQPLF